MNHTELTSVLLALLNRWQEGRLNEREVFEEAERIVENVDYPWPTEEDTPERVLPYKVLDTLEELPRELVTQDDIPFLLDILSVHYKNDAQSAIRAFSSYFTKQRWYERREQLRGQAFTEGGTKWYYVSDNPPHWYN